jgi:DNA protecting protein DprA
VFEAEESALRAVLPEVGDGLISKLKRGGDNAEARRVLSYCEKTGVTVLTPESREYPTCLWAIDEPPAALYCRGRLPLPSGVPFVGVVGKRETDTYGEEVTYRLSFELASAGAVIVSGMAEGVDGVAATAAIEAGGFTVAVLGTGIDRVYPRHHKRLFSEIAEYGLVVTEFAPGTPPNARNFPIRNRLISALSEAVVVTEADGNSGALITARYALLQGKSLYAVPGDITRARSEGCNLLLRGGAGMALSAEDVLSHFRFLYRENMKVPAEAIQYTGVTEQILRAHGVKPAEQEKKPTKEKPEGKGKAKETDEQLAAENRHMIEAALSRLNERERTLYTALPDTPFTVDVLVSPELSAGGAIAAMTLLEMYGLVSSRPGGVYVKK